MKQEFEVSAEELLRTLKRRGIPLPSEMGAFITLEVCEQILDRPVAITTEDVAISEIGEVLCAAQLTATSEGEAQRSLMMLLADLLVCAAPGVPSMLLELVERGPRGEPSLSHLRDELEACLLPLNRGATRRVLARLLRETRKAGPSLRASLPPSAADMEAQFDALMGPAARRVVTRPSLSPRREPVRGGSTPSHPARSGNDRMQSANVAGRAASEVARAANAAADRAASEVARSANAAARGATDVARPGNAPARSASEVARPGPARSASEAARSASQLAQPANTPSGALDSAPPEPSADEVDAQFDALMLDPKLAAKPNRAEPAPAPSASARSRPRPPQNQDRRPSGLDMDRAPTRPMSPRPQPSAAKETAGPRTIELDVGPTAPLFQLDDDSHTPIPGSLPVRLENDAALHSHAGDSGSSDEERPARPRARNEPAVFSDAQTDAEADANDDASDPSAADSIRRQHESRHHASTRADDTPREPGFRAGQGPRLDIDDLEEASPPPARIGLKVFALCVVASLGLLVAYTSLGREGSRSALGLLPQPSAASEPAPRPAPIPRSIGNLHVTSNPARAQVLLLIGQGPALATDLPLGVAQEFVALADGYAPSRALVPSDAAWEEIDGQPRYELAIQAAKAGSEAAKTNLGSTLLPRDVGTPRPRLGSVRVVTTPKGAKVYQLIGFTPDARVENLPLDRSYELVVYLEGHAPVTRQILPGDFTARDGKRAAEIDVALPSVKAPH